MRAAGAAKIYPDRILKDTNAAAILRTRTLTSLYNERPQWLADAHSDLDGAVAAAYDWPTEVFRGRRAGQTVGTQSRPRGANHSLIAFMRRLGARRFRGRVPGALRHEVPLRRTGTPVA